LIFQVRLRLSWLLAGLARFLSRWTLPQIVMRLARLVAPSSDLRPTPVKVVPDRYRRSRRRR
jgi:hypothetical protein